MTQPRVCVLDYGFGNVRSAVRALEHVGAQVELTADPDTVSNADGLVVPECGSVRRRDGRVTAGARRYAH